ncbi:acyl-CoA carboxylase subunit epsilon [Demequina aestuarii]|uniref:acyl-CoA carboxylase subunit epsilon n=1 Tax=Demequina aestuarii TaxID=327095 RepID=UPI000783B298|nr:acyl-CoA carboxylase subunit epsilon [Demequina aestuarii]
MTNEAPDSGLRVLRGSPDDSEVAALVAGMAAIASAADEEPEPGAPTSAWMDRSRTMRGQHHSLPLARGGAAWRTSLR